jgi:hypothetical protein
MEERSPRTVSRSVATITLTLAVALAVVTGGCRGLYAGPRTVASVGALAIVAGSGAWAGGEALQGGSHDGAGRSMVGAGFVTVLAGLAAIVVAGGWIAASVACEHDPDCPDEEQCREVPAPPGGIPYKQCIPR